MKSILITGATSGIGFETAKLFLSQKWRVYATMRHLDKAKALQLFAQDMGATENLTVLTCDVTSDQSVQNLLSDISELDAVVNNAGFGFMGALEDFSVDELKTQFETNLFGVHRVVKIMLPVLKKSLGTIVNVSSMGGKVTFPFFAAYNASKFALESYTEGLWMELTPLGMRVYLIEPGLIETNFYSSSLKFPKNYMHSTSIYKKLYEKYVENPKAASVAGRSHPKVVAERMYQIITKRPSQFRHPVGKFAGSILLTRWLLPDRIFLPIISRIRR